MNPEEITQVPFVAATPEAAEGTLFSCPLCGGHFSHGQAVCSACPLRPRCDFVGCPHCGYQFPRTSVIVEALGRLVRWLGRRRP
jgi:hypothetical protein